MEQTSQKANPAMAETPMLAAAQAFQAANPDLQLVVIPLFGPDGKLPYPHGGAHPEIATGWQKRVLSVPGDHPAWKEATGWGIVLTNNPHLLIVDVDKPEELTAEQQAALNESPGLTYPTRRGCHHWYRVQPGDHPPITGKAGEWPGGEIWYHTARLVAGPGSQDKPAPTGLTVPDHAPPLKVLLPPTDSNGSGNARRERDPNWNPADWIGQWKIGTTIEYPGQYAIIASVATALLRRMTTTQVTNWIVDNIWQAGLLPDDNPKYPWTRRDIADRVRRADCYLQQQNQKQVSPIQVPRERDIMLSVLQALGAIGGSGKPKEVIAGVGGLLGVTGEQWSSKVKSGLPRIEDRTRWASDKLKNIGCLDKYQGIWYLTDQGKKYLYRSQQESPRALNDELWNKAMEYRQNSPS